MRSMKILLPAAIVAGSLCRPKPRRLGSFSTSADEATSRLTIPPSGVSKRAKKELGIEYEYIEPSEAADRENALRQFASGQFDLVIGIGFIFTDDVNRVRQGLPPKPFACVDYAVNARISRCPRTWWPSSSASRKPPSSAASWPRSPRNQGHRLRRRHGRPPDP